MRKKITFVLLAVTLLTAGNISYAEEAVQAAETEQTTENIEAVVLTEAENAEAEVLTEAEATEEAVITETETISEENTAEVVQMTDKTQAEAIAWVKSQLGKAIDDDGFAGVQCVDLIRAYYRYLGVSPTLGNGADYASNPLPKGWTRIKDAVPQEGDILVYTGGPGGYGHAGIFESANSSYHQNISSKKYVERVTGDYKAWFSTTPYWGVVRPDFVSDGMPSKPKYADVVASDWFYDEVNYVFERGLMTGLAPDRFGPYESLSRAQFATILYRMEGAPETTYRNQFSDVSEGQWYTSSIIWANDEKIVSGYDNSTLFGTGDNITREQMTVMMFRYAQYKGYDTSQRADFSKFHDASLVSEFARDSMEWAVSKGIISGKENETMIDPQGEAKRAECAIIIQRFIESHQ